MRKNELEFYENAGNWDFLKEMIKTANQNLKKYPTKNVKFIMMYNLNITFPKNTSDLVSA